MKSKTKLTCLLLASFLASCGQGGGDSSFSSSSDPNKNGYEDYYVMNNEKQNEIQGKSVYDASSGYLGNNAQGYNGFFYKGFKDNGYEDLKWEVDRFLSNDGAYLQNEVMVSSAETLATRLFLVPVSGSAKIRGTLKLHGECKSASISIKILDGDFTLVKDLGSFHCTEEDGIYIEEKVALEEGQQIVFVLSSESEASFNPSIDFELKEESLLHQFIDGEYGDVHPYYDAKNHRMMMYYLSTGREQNSVHEQFSTLATASTDMVNFEQIELSKNPKNPPSINTYYALGVYEDADGNYRSCFGQGNYVGNSKSKDLIYWENGEEVYLDEETGMLDYNHRVNFGNDVFSGRDPHIFYDKEAETYYCIVMNYYSSQLANGKKGLAIYKGDKNGKYSYDYKKALDTTGRGDPECPEIFKINDRYYIFYSIYGTGTSGNVGKLAYRIGDVGKNPFEIDWDSKEELYLDGEDNHAAQLTEADGKYYMYGWLTSTPYQNTWGGTLSLSKEVYQREDGTLASRLDPMYQQFANKGRIRTFSEEEKEFKGLPRSILQGSFTPSGANYREGFEIKSNDLTYFAGIEKNGNDTYLTMVDKETSGRAVKVKLNETREVYDVSVYLDGDYVDLFVNDEYALSSHVNFRAPYDVKLVTSNTNELVKAHVNKLATGTNFLK